MVYQFRAGLGVFPVNAQTAGEELERIYAENGELSPEKVVDESRPVDAPLHDCFEWNDEKAAEMYRQRQAGDLIRAVVVVEEREEKPAIEARAFVHAKKSYHPIEIALNDPDMTKELLEDAYRDMESFKKKYDSLHEMRLVVAAIDVTIEHKNDDKNKEEHK